MTIFGYNMKRIFLRPLNLVFMVVIPIVLNVLLISIATNDTKYTIGIRDLDDTAFTRELAEHIEEISDVVVITEDDSIKQMVIDEKVDIAMELPKGYTESLIQGNQELGKVVNTYAIDDTNSADSAQMYVKSVLEAARQLGMAAAGDEEKFYDGMEQYYQQDYKVKYEKFATSVAESVGLGVQSLGYVALGIAFLMMFATGLIQEDKLTGVYDRIHVTPLNLFRYYMEHLLSYLVVAVIQIAVLFAVLTNYVGISYGDTTEIVIETGVCSVVFAFVCIAIGVCASRFARTRTMATALVTVVDIPMLMICGCLWPRSVMPKLMQRIGDFLPATWYLKSAEKVLYGHGIGSVWQYVGGMIGVAVILIAIAFAVRTDKAK